MDNNGTLITTGNGSVNSSNNVCSERNSLLFMQFSALNLTANSCEIRFEKPYSFIPAGLDLQPEIFNGELCNLR